MNVIDAIPEISAHVPILSRSEFFHPIKTGDVLGHMKKMRDGDTIPITHGWLVTRIGEQIIMTDPAMRANESPQGRFKQMQGEDHTRSDVADDKYRVSIFQDESVHEVARALAPAVQTILITHLDSDHLDFGLIKEMMDANPQLEVYGPLGWQKFIGETHRFEGEIHPVRNPVLPETIRTRLHGLSPISYLGEKPESLSSRYPQLHQRLHMAIVEEGNTTVQITSLDVPHMGSKYAETVQGFLLESEGVRKLLLPDAALSPEVVDLVERLHKEKPLTGITVSTGKFNPEPLMEIPVTKKSSITVPSPETSDKLRTTYEEFLGHSAFLPFALAGVTHATVPIDMIHLGFYHNSIPDISQVTRRVAISEKNTLPSWTKGFTHMLEDLYQRLDKRISKLGPLTSDPQGRHPVFRFLGELKTRSDFSNSLIRWIKDNPPPKTILHDDMHAGPVSLPLPLTAKGKKT